jgi:hypothetical protein
VLSTHPASSPGPRRTGFTDGKLIEWPGEKAQLISPNDLDPPVLSVDRHGTSEELINTPTGVSHERTA